MVSATAVTAQASRRPTMMSAQRPVIRPVASRANAATAAGGRNTVRQVGVDLADDWTSAPQDAGFRAGVPSCWLAEGLIVDPRRFENSEGPPARTQGRWALVGEFRPVGSGTGDLVFDAA